MNWRYRYLAMFYYNMSSAIKYNRYNTRLVKISFLIFIRILDVLSILKQVDFIHVHGCLYSMFFCNLLLGQEFQTFYR